VSQANRARRARNRAITERNKAASAQFIAEQQTRPEVIAKRAAVAADTEAAAILNTGRAGQQARLRAGGWRMRYDGDDGLGCWDQPRYGLRIIHSGMRELDGQVWGHVSVSRRDGRFPAWEQVRDAQWLVYPDRAGIVVVAPPGEHVNLREVAHVWTCLTAEPFPDFSHGLGTI
jgi:hypothetical protein